MASWRPSAVPPGVPMDRIQVERLPPCLSYFHWGPFEGATETVSVYSHRGRFPHALKTPFASVEGKIWRCIDTTPRTVFGCDGRGKTSPRAIGAQS
jgi:hypothetical protein